jgi:hypothetical protein
MVQDFVQTVVKLAIASLIVGTVMTHFGVTPEKFIGAFGLTPERALELAQQGMTWALPNLTLGALIIVPVWFVVYLVPPAAAAQRLVRHQSGAPEDSGLVPDSFVSSDAAMMPSATTAMMIVHTALISGRTPSRTSE